MKHYKGTSYTATVAIQPGVYGKTRMFVLTDGKLRQLRLNHSVDGYAAGDRIRFIAQVESENGSTYLRANVKTLTKTGVPQPIVFVAANAWPDATGSFDLAGDVTALDRRSLTIEVGGKIGVIVLPKKTASRSIGIGDRIDVRGFFSPGENPELYAAGTDALTVVEYAKAAKAAASAKPAPPPAGFIAALTAIVALAGLLAYLRNERLKRVALMQKTLSEEIDD